MFGVAGDIDATENNFASDPVAKLAILNPETKRRHCVSQCVDSSPNRAEAGVLQ